jgi:hypothetical protein
MKAHIGVDSKTKLIHSVVATAANVHDSQVIGDLLHGDVLLQRRSESGCPLVRSRATDLLFDSVTRQARRDIVTTATLKEKGNEFPIRLRAICHNLVTVMPNNPPITGNTRKA